MRKILFIPFLLLLAACGAAQEIAPTAEIENEDSLQVTSDEPAEVAESDSRVNESITISKNPADAGVVRSRDWTKGTDDPLITIIEYGDFQ